MRAAITCEEAFTPAVSPTDIANWNANEHYRTDEKFPVALTDALHEEYQKIVDAGLLLQIDDPQLVNMGPRVHDMELQHIVDIMLGVQATAYSLEAGNPRHEHERRVRELVKLPESKLLIPGIITHASNLVEHPEAVAPRIGRFAAVVGCENVIAGVDCGFASLSTSCEVHPSVVWAKLAALAKGAHLATKELWGKA